ncbi:MAG: hypothetical protein PVJ51_07350 [Acidobacteriota bacterium]
MRPARALPFLLVFVVVLSATPVLATPAVQETRPTDLVVQVRDEAGTPLAGQEVFVVVSNGTEVTDELTGTSTDDGEVRFEGVAAGEGYTARPIAVSEGFPYQGDRITLVPGELTILPLTIASISDTPVSLHIDVLHIILNVVEPGVYQALEVMSVLNIDERAAYGNETYQGQRVGLVIPLPTGATQVTPLPPEMSGLDPDRLVQDGNRLLDLRPVPPGNRQVAVQYEIVTDPDGGDLELTVPHPTQQVSLLLGPGLGTVSIESEQLSELEPVTIPDQGQYANFTSDVLSAGDTLRFHIGPDNPPLSPASWALLALAAALLASAAASFALTRKPAHEPDERGSLLAAVARLDDRHAAGELSDSIYYAQRGELLGRLMELGRGSGATPDPDARGD